MALRTAEERAIYESQSRDIIGILDQARTLLSMRLEQARPADISRADWMHRIGYWDSLAADDYADMYRDSDDS